MRPSELKAANTPTLEEDGQKKYPSSSRADPPITEAETAGAQVSICRWHDGLIKLTGDKDGRVFFCPKGNQYWRWRKANQRFWRSLKVIRRGIV
jgi:hypothetical protein